METLICAALLCQSVALQGCGHGGITALQARLKASELKADSNCQSLQFQVGKSAACLLIMNAARMSALKCPMCSAADCITRLTGLAGSCSAQIAAITVRSLPPTIQAILCPSDGAQDIMKSIAFIKPRILSVLCCRDGNLMLPARNMDVHWSLALDPLSLLLYCKPCYAAPWTACCIIPSHSRGRIASGAGVERRAVAVKEYLAGRKIPKARSGEQARQTAPGSFQPIPCMQCDLMVCMYAVTCRHWDRASRWMPQMIRSRMG